MREFVQPIAELLANRPVPLRQVMLYQYGEGGQAHGTGEFVFDASGLFFGMFRPTWFETPLVQPLLDLVERHDDLEKLLAADAGGQPITDSFHRRQFVSLPLAAFTIDYLDQATDKPAPWDIRRFDMLYRRFAWSLVGGHHHVQLWAPAYHLDWIDANERVSLTQGCFLTTPTREWQVRLSRTFSVDAGPRYFGAPPRFCLQHEELRPYRQPVTLAGLEAIRNCVIAIRMAVGGDAAVHEQRVFGRPGEARLLGTPISHIYGLEPAWSFGNPSRVSASAIPQIRKLGQKVGELMRGYPIAMDRFGLISDRRRQEDRLIDSAIGLESLLLQGLKDELRFQFSLRGALLLGKRQVDRRNWFQKLRRIYDARSDLVHADAKKSMKIAKEVVADSVEALRLCLVAVAGRSLTPQLLQSWLNDMVLR